jgi:histidinol phosphatase-like PHP family hydrolase
MLDFHTHTFASDGVLVASELVRRAQAAGYRAIAITDHADETNLDDLVARAVAASAAWKGSGIVVVPGVEITHVPPQRIAALAARARRQGARVVVVHGETVTEPVAPGTNAAAAACPDVDVLAHPGLIGDREAAAAAERGLFLEITTRRGHSVANGHVAAAARRSGAPLLVDTDAHEPGDLVTVAWARTVLAAAGLSAEEADRVFANAERLLKRVTD